MYLSPARQRYSGGLWLVGFHPCAGRRLMRTPPRMRDSSSKENKGSTRRTISYIIVFEDIYLVTREHRFTSQHRPHLDWFSWLLIRLWAQIGRIIDPVVFDSLVRFLLRFYAPPTIIVDPYVLRVVYEKLQQSFHAPVDFVNIVKPW